MYQRGQLIEATISDRAEDDRCFARLGDGICVFVQGYLAVGDVVEAEILKVKKNYLEAKAKRVLQPSAQRTAPRCTHFGVCGGCKWQHLNYDAQLAQKVKHVQDALEHIGNFTAIPMHRPIGAELIFHYRNKIEFSFSNERFLLEEERHTQPLNKPADFALGFHAPHRYDKVVDIDLCYIAPPEVNTALNVVKAFAMRSTLAPYSPRTNEGFWRHLSIRKAFRTGEVMVNLVTSWYEEALMQAAAAELQQALGTALVSVVNNITTHKGGVSIGEEEKIIFGKGFITEKLGKWQFEISANSFFQTNTLQAERLYETVLKMAQLTPNDTVYDLYCGTGSIAIFVSPYCKKVLGIEVVESAVRDAMRNAARNAVQNCVFHQLDLKDFGKLEPELNAFGMPDVVITDPPRAGMHPDAVKTLLKLAPKRIIYVSCNPASLARDAKLLCEHGKYSLCEVQAIDMFPHTNHIESVARLEKNL
jgi:23S rRNA (uracil1939-C5)-methyltransferase